MSKIQTLGSSTQDKSALTQKQKLCCSNCGLSSDDPSVSEANWFQAATHCPKCGGRWTEEANYKGLEGGELCVG